MPKRTIKYSKALEVAETLQISQVNDQERLYRDLNAGGFFWDATTKTWERSHEPADPPTQLIRVRVWTDSAKVRGASQQIKTVLEQSGYELVEQSDPYSCRPPKQLESRIYLTFQQRR